MNNNGNSNDNNVNNQWDRGDKISLAFSVLAFIVSIISILVTIFTNTARFEVFEDLKYEQLKMVANLKSIETKAFFAQSTSKKQSTSKEFNYSQEMSNIDLLRTNPSHLIFLSSISEWEERKRLEENLIMLSNNINTNNSGVILSTTRNALRVMADDSNRNKIKNKDLNKIMSSLCRLIINDKNAKYAPNRNLKTRSQPIIKQASLLPLFRQFDNEGCVKGIDLKDDEDENKNEISQQQQDSANYHFNYAFQEAPFEEFLWYLIYHKQVYDPDVCLFYGVLENNDSLVNIAFANGGNINVTVDEIIEKYKNEYEEYNTTPYSYVRIGDNGNINEQDGEGFGMKTREFIKYNLLFICSLIAVITFMITAFNAIRIMLRLKRKDQHVDEKEEETSVAKVEETTQQEEEVVQTAAVKENVQQKEKELDNNEVPIQSEDDECGAIPTFSNIVSLAPKIQEREEAARNKEKLDAGKTVQFSDTDKEDNLTELNDLVDQMKKIIEKEQIKQGMNTKQTLKKIANAGA